MLQYDLFLIVILAGFVLFGFLNIRAYLKRRESKIKIGSLLSIEDIHRQFFSYTDKEKFGKYWPIFCKLVGPEDAYNYLDSPVPTMEKFFPFSDLYYENLETFLTNDDGDIRNLTIRDLFDKYYQRKN